VLEKFLFKVDTKIRQQSLEIQAFKVKQWSMYERLKEMGRTMQEQESVLAFQKEVAEQAWWAHY
jgi:hypothetical protein